MEELEVSPDSPLAHKRITKGESEAVAMMQKKAAQI